MYVSNPSFRADIDTTTHAADGIEALSTQVGIADAGGDVRALVLVWKLGSQTVEPLKPGCIKRAEFTQAMTTLRQDSAAGLAKLMPTFDTGFMEQKEFREFFRFVHKFSREDGTQKKFLEKAFVVELLPIVVDASRAPHLSHFLRYLNTLPDSTTISADQWDSFLMFNSVVGLDLSGYDEDTGAWPVLLDEYVDWRNSEKK